MTFYPTKGLMGKACWIILYFQLKYPAIHTTNNRKGNRIMLTRTRSRNRNRGMIKPNTLMPVRIMECEEGNITSRGTSTLKFTFQHLISKEVFKSTVFEESPPLYVSEQILDAVLPEDTINYSLEDLVGKGLMVEVAFNTSGSTTFINVVKATPLQASLQQSLHKLQQLDEQERKAKQEEMNEIENEMIDKTNRRGHADEQNEDDTWHDDSYADLDLDIDNDYSERDEIDFDLAELDDM
jgi:hypothetical protein